MSESSQGARAASDIAVIGMAGFFPHAPDKEVYWGNIIKGLVAIGEVPAQRWDWRQYYDADQRQPDKINSKWGAYLPDITFDPLYFGIPPKSLPFIETSQLLLLESTRLALADAGYLDRPFDRNRTSVFIGTGAGEGDLGQQYSFRSQLPRYFGSSAENILEGLNGTVPEWREDAFTGIIMNIAAGRIADRFNLGGTNCTIDAACASALAALRSGILELRAGECDLVIAGGADTLMSPYAYTCFSKVGALSGTGKSIPFDDKADGIVLGECVATVILKRLAEAEHDGDTIYAVVKGIGSSSDGRGKGLTVPKPEGQVAAISRAYENAGIDPATVGLIEAHGTSTRAGDKAEAEALKTFFSQTGMPAMSCAVGSVKSMIGHTKCAAGIASLIKAVLALHHKTLPPTAGVETPLPNLDGEDNPLYISTRSRPWISGGDYPRRAGVSAFGFGGTNFHVVLEEYGGLTETVPEHFSFTDWDTELLVFQADTTEALSGRLRPMIYHLSQSPVFSLKDLAYTLAVTKQDSGNVRLAIVAGSLKDAARKMETAMNMMAGPESEYRDTAGIYFSRVPAVDTGKVAFVYPGQGSQYTGMFNDLSLAFPFVRRVFDRFDHHLHDVFPAGLSRFVFPPVAFRSEEKKAGEKALTRTNVAQAAMGAVDTAMNELLTRLGAAPDMLAGHSYGEYPALFAAGVLEEEALARISEARGRFILASATPEPGTMAAVKAPEANVAPVLADMDEVWIANLNSPVQTVISGTAEGVKAAMEQLSEKGIASKQIPVSCAFHSPIVDGARDRLQGLLGEFPFVSPCIPVYSNTIADCFPASGDTIKELLVQQLISPVRFVEEIEAMYAQGVRTFVEVGAGTVLTNLIGTILKDKPHHAVATDKRNVAGLAQLQHALAVLVTAGQNLKLERLYQGRGCRRLDPYQLNTDERREKAGPAFVIGGGTVRRLDQPAPELVVPRPVCFADAPSGNPMETATVDAPADQRKDNNIKDDQFYGEIMGSPFNQNQPSMSMDRKTERPAVDDTVIARFQDLMGQFLDTQKAVMTAYLNGTDVGALQADPAAQQMPDMQQPGMTGTNAATSVKDFPAASPGAAASEAGMPSAGPNAGPNAGTEPPPAEAAAPAVDTSQPAIDIKPLLLDIISDCTGYPVDMLEMEQEIEADLGIDSIKRMQAMEELEAALEKNGLRLPEDRREELVESLTLADLLAGVESIVTGADGAAAASAPESSAAVSGPPEKTVSSAVSPDTAADNYGASTLASPGVSVDVAGMLMNVVSDLSGYPVDMLETDQEIDADLGIDSIKRMQILEHFEAELETLHMKLPDGDREQLAESVTLGDIIDILTTMIAGQNTSPEGEVSASGDGSADTGDTADKDKGAGVPAPDVVAKTRDVINGRLYAIVETHTGYPAEMLEPDLKLATDLQLDAAIMEMVAADVVDGLERAIPEFRMAAEKLWPVSPVMLGDLTAWLMDALASIAGGLEAASAALDQGRSVESGAAAETAPPGMNAVRRFTIVANPRPLIPSAGDILQETPILVTKTADDALAEAVISKLQSSRGQVVVLAHDPTAHSSKINAGPSVYAVDFTDDEQLAAAMETIRNAHGPVAGLLHLTPLAAGEGFADMDMGTWQGENAVKVKSLFHITKALSEDLAAAAQAGDGSLVAATAMGGTFASVPADGEPADGESVFQPTSGPASGGVGGFLKALAEEMPGLNIRVVDNDPADQPEIIAAQVTDELLTLSADIEVGYRKGTRVSLDIKETPLPDEGDPVLEIDSESCLLVTGGARGITASVVLELARRFQATFLLVGRTPFVETEGTETAGVTDEKQLKATLADQLKAEHGKIRPIDLEKTYNRLMGQREIRDTLEQLRASGAAACYLQGDVTDPDGFARLIDSVYDQYGRIDGVIHGAGRIEDKMVRDKDAASFDRVFDTKADSLFILSHALQSDKLRFLALFSSLAGRFGNAGQSDYGAANEVYNKTALYLNRTWPGRVVSFIWGPWESQGMVSAGLRKKFNQSGLTLIPRQEGAQYFVNELLRGRANDTEVVYGGWDDRKKAMTTARRAAVLPLLSFNANFYPCRDGRVELVRRVDASIDQYLGDHQLDGHPVMPLAMAMEMMAEAIAYRYPDYHLNAFSDVHVLKGIVINNGPADVHIIVKPVEKSDAHVVLEIEIRGSREENRVFYRANAELSREKQAGNPHPAISLSDAGPFSLSVAEAYDTRLFHGPLWQGIEAIESVGKNGIIGNLKRSRPDAYFQETAAVAGHDWFIDPLIIDSGLQLVVLWMREQMDATPLPSHLNRFVWFDTPKRDDLLRCEVRVHVPEESGTKSADLFFVTPDGMLAGRMEGLEIIGSEALNRLAKN
ncbi:MAG: SDR family NAD(P)-dependent oxidoreductase [Thermodesulfobacteriota bacterium]|nr:SDR family NAD(P)-dependent oxidoreductase [Thermodesulfobacteriota bacterium]